MKNMFSLDGKVAFGESNIGKNGRKWFSRDDFLCRFLLDGFFIKISLPLDVGSTFRK